MTVLDWLLDSDPAIRWQVMRDLNNAPAEAIAAERAKIATEGWGARLLALQDAEGQWGRDVLPASSEQNGDGLPDVATRKLLLELHDVSLDQLAGYLDLEAEALAAWENDPYPNLDDEGIDKYRAALNWMRNSIGT